MAATGRVGFLKENLESLSVVFVALWNFLRARDSAVDEMRSVHSYVCPGLRVDHGWFGEMRQI